MFRYEAASQTWKQEAKLLASDGVANDYFGWSVAISGETVLAGSLTNDKGTNSGAAYVFRFDAGTWVEETKLLASDGAQGDHFGWSVAIDGDLAVAGAFGDDDSGDSSGSAYVFRFDGAAWVEEAKLTDPDGEASDILGESVAVSGNAVVAGAYAHEPGGAAFVFRLGCLGWTLDAHLFASDTQPCDTFGGAVAIDGDVVVVGAGGHDANGPLAGAAYVYRFDGQTWVEDATLLASDGTAFDTFGSDVAVAGDVALIGADKDDDNGGDSGSAYVFAGLLGADCNGNGAPDACDLDAGTSEDADLNGVPDECDCPWDLDGSGTVATGDLLALLAQWGGEPAGPPDFDGSGAVGAADLLILLANWGPCPLFADCNGNGVLDALDIARGRSADCNGNGMPDECDLADGTSPDCNGNGTPDECDLAGCTSADCNRNFVPDECDVAGGNSPDTDGDGVPDECAFTADDCKDAVAITEGATPFFTIGATTDGPLIDCGRFSLDPFLDDVWFVYTPTCTGTATLTLCNDADFDTILAVYLPAECPSPTTLMPLACSDDAPGCGQTSQVEIVAIKGVPYLVRVGSPSGAEGTGVLTVSCRP